jgi:hypothetical protein
VDVLPMILRFSKLAPGRFTAKVGVTIVREASLAATIPEGRHAIAVATWDAAPLALN